MSTLSNNTIATDSQRHSINFDPSVWGDFFITYKRDNKNVQAWCEEAKMLNEKVRKTLEDESIMISEQLQEKINMIDTIQRLGIGHHFIAEIQEMLERIFKFLEDENNYERYELKTLALLFRILRQQGHNISCDIFNRFKEDGKDEFKEVITEDVEGMLSLYEATHLRVHGETILEKALDFTKTTLENKVPYLKPSLAKHVRHALKWPIQKCLPRLGAREFISFYQDGVESHDEDLLKFAKLDFNLLQIQHREELNAISKWWKDLDVKKNIPYARDRIAECYFWILGAYYEPEHAVARNFAVKVISLTSLLDDTYDEYGTYEELELFTAAIQRWDISAIDEIPEYMKIIYQMMLRIYDEMEEELIKEGRSYEISYSKQAIKKLVKAYLAEAKWVATKEMPSMEEYMSVAIPSSAYQHVTIATCVGMKQVRSQDIFNWLSNDPLVLDSVSRICRFMDDIVPHQGELKGESLPSALNCYMKQYNVSASEAVDYLNKEVENAWKDINSAFLDPTVPSRSVLLNILGLARVIELFYSDEDIYTCSEKMKPYVASLLVNPLEV